MKNQQSCRCLRVLSQDLLQKISEDPFKAPLSLLCTRCVVAPSLLSCLWPLVRRCAVRPRRRRVLLETARSALRCSPATQAWSAFVGADALLAYQQLGSAGRVRGPDLGHASPPLVVARLAESVTNAVARRASAGRVVESTTTSPTSHLRAKPSSTSAASRLQ